MQKYEPTQIETEVLAFWEKHKTYEKAKEKNTGKKRFYFLDGPPYTSGKMHIGLAWNKSMKDSILRYKRMNGVDVYDRAGYDMHGLPTENKTMEKLGLKSKDDIPAYGIKKFIEECRKLSIENMNIMSKDFERLGVWMDFKNAYQPIKPEFIDGEWWLIRKAFENHRLYEGQKVMHWCQNCATALAKHELEYQKDEDTSIFLKFKVIGRPDEYLLIWTTTPWTIPFNLGVMVHPELDYVRIRVDNEIWIVAKGLVGLFMGSIEKEYKIIREFKGEELNGLGYEHPLHDEIKIYDELKKKSAKVHTIVLSEEYVNLSAGTGLVHMAPGCGPEDYEIGHREGIPPFNNLDEFGVFPEGMGKFKGWSAKNDDQKFIEEFERKGCLVASSPVEHDYAHCWRCKKPVIFRTTKQWFFKVEDLKNKMKELNKNVYWVPDWAGSRWFDSWLENLRDNSITRQRYWGTPVPIWKCKCGQYKVIGSIKELQAEAGKVPKDLHKPYIDEVTIKCSCGDHMHRIPDILDVWIDAGTNSWTALNYPTDTKLFEELFPADFILEGKDQIRGWFNLLLVASMISMDKHPYKAVYMHGFTNDSQGRKMSKSLGNIISPYEVIDKYGADCFRLYSISAASPGLDMNYNPEDLKAKYRNLNVLWNVHKFLLDFAKQLDKHPKKAKHDELDIPEKYIISRLNSSIKKVTELFESYRINEVPVVIEELFLDFSRDYIQLVRDKCNSGTDNQKETVLFVLHEVLMGILKLLSPICPLTTEAIYQNLIKEFKTMEESIHHFDWPKPDEKSIDTTLEQDFKLSQEIVQAVLFAREKIGLGQRWPLKDLFLHSKKKEVMEAIETMQDVIKKQTNIKQIHTRKVKVVYEVRSDYNKLGPRYGKLAPSIIAQLSLNSAESIMNHIEKSGSFKVTVNDKVYEIKEDDLIIEKKLPETLFDASTKHMDIFINKTLTKELEAEGYAREIGRRIQSQRKTAGLSKTDAIDLVVKTDEELKEMLKNWHDHIKEKVGAKKLGIMTEEPEKEFKFRSKEKVKKKEFDIYFNRV